VNIFSDVISFILSLAINLLLIGLIVVGGTATAFRFIGNSSPRFRYVIAVIAFVVAAFVPLAVTSGGVLRPQSIPTPVINAANRNLEVASSSSSDRIKATDLPADAPAFDQTGLSPETDLLADFTLYISSSWLGWLFSGLWICAAACLLLREVVSHWELKNERKRWQVANAEQRGKFFFPDNVTLYFADHDSFTTGFFSPAIVLPRWFPNNLIRTSIQGIVLHEMAHAKWRDPLVNSLLRIVRALFWVSPALWFLENIIRLEREAAADRAALASLCNSGEADKSPADYATAIISMAKLSAADSPGWQRCLAHFGGASNLENRINRILNARSQPARLSLFVGTAVFLMSVLALTIIPASIPLMRVQAELSPNISDSSELNAPDVRPDSRSSLQHDRDGRPSKRRDSRRATANTTARKASDKAKGTQVREIPPARSVAEQRDNKDAEQKIQIINSPNRNVNSQLKLDYRGDSAKPVMRIVTTPIVRVVF
jgi:beta-lactamase regulating signal transducer with metallopeptidase domain